MLLSAHVLSVSTLRPQLALVSKKVTNAGLTAHAAAVPNFDAKPALNPNPLKPTLLVKTPPAATAMPVHSVISPK